MGKVGIKDFNIIIKLPATNPTYPYNSWVDKSLKNSFRKLRIKKADTVLVHNASFLINKKTGNKIMNQLEKYKKKIIKKIGVSVYSISDLRKVIKKYKIDTVLISLNVFDQRVLEDKVIKNLKNNNIEILTRSTFLQGLLLIKKINYQKNFILGEKNLIIGTKN